MEKGHLHNGVDARAKAALTGDFRRVNHIKARLLLIQRGLYFLGQAGPYLISAVGVLSRKMPPGFNRSTI